MLVQVGEKMRGKKITIITNVLLLVWFFLDMVGVSFGGKVLVTRSWKEDGIFFLLYITSFMWFIFKDKSGKIILTVFLTLWLSLQIYFHWYFTIFGPWKGKIQYFSGTIKLFKSDVIYLADLYHIVLHLLILLALVSMVRYVVIQRDRTHFA
jgi:hypothetical protein